MQEKLVLFGKRNHVSINLDATYNFDIKIDGFNDNYFFKLIETYEEGVFTKFDIYFVVPYLFEERCESIQMSFFKDKDLNVMTKPQLHFSKENIIELFLNSKMPQSFSVEPLISSPLGQNNIFHCTFSDFLSTIHEKHLKNYIKEVSQEYSLNDHFINQFKIIFDYLNNSLLNKKLHTDMLIYNEPFEKLILNIEQQEKKKLFTELNNELEFKLPISKLKI